MESAGTRASSAGGGQKQFPCSQCGANLVYAPGTLTMRCGHCGTANRIELDGTPVREIDYLSSLRAAEASDTQVQQLTVKCDRCAAEVILPPNTMAGLCAFCGSPIVAVGASRRLIKPRALLPFAISEQVATKQFRAWIARLWFAPSKLARQAGEVRLRGVYIPAWTYDSRTRTVYSGQRGDDYWETEWYWDTETYIEHENGRAVTRTRRVHKSRQVRKTRWTPVSGMVANSFDDLLVLASHSLPDELAHKLEPWDLQSLVPYHDEFVAGFVCEAYSVGLEQGFGVACQMMSPTIYATICRDIGGDHQRVNSSDTDYFQVTYKHILLPVWLCAYRYREQTYRFLVNARTGEIQGERPYSAAKIALLVLLIVIAIIAVGLAISANS